MAKKRRYKRKNNFDYPNIIGLILSILMFFRLFYLGDFLYILWDYLFSWPKFFSVLAFLYFTLKLSKIDKHITNQEKLGVLVLYIAIGLLWEKGLIFYELSTVLTILLTGKFKLIIVYVLLITSLVLLFSRYKNIIRNELGRNVNKTVNKTSYAIKDLKDKSVKKKEETFRSITKEQDINYIENYILNNDYSDSSLFDSISYYPISSYANSIYQYLENIKTAIVGVANKIESEVIFQKEIISIEYLSIKFSLKDIQEKNYIIKMLPKIIKNSRVVYSKGEFILSVKYNSDLIINLKDMIICYNQKDKLNIGITNFGNTINVDNNTNIVLNGDHFKVINKFLEILFLEIIFKDEKIIIVDVNNQILRQYLNKDAVILEPIKSIADFKNLIKWLKLQIRFKQEYASDLGYNSYLDYIKEKEKSFDIYNIIINDINFINWDLHKKLFSEFKNILLSCNDYGYRFIIINSNINNNEQFNYYLKDFQNMYFSTSSSAISKQLVNSKILTKIQGTYSFYIKINNTLTKVFFPGNDKNHKLFEQMLPDVSRKNNFLMQELKLESIYDELKSKFQNNELITATFIMTNYQITKSESIMLLNRLQKGV